MGQNHPDSGQASKAERIARAKKAYSLCNFFNSRQCLVGLCQLCLTYLRLTFGSNTTSLRNDYKVWSLTTNEEKQMNWEELQIKCNQLSLDCAFRIFVF
jgi:hypothetical protein